MAEKGMGVPGPAVFQPEQYRRNFAPQHIIGHLREVLAIVEELEADPGIPMDLRVSVFNVVQAMTSSMESKAAAEEARRALVGLDGAGVAGLR